MFYRCLIFVIFDSRMLFRKRALVDDDSISFEIVFKVGYKIDIFHVLHFGVCKLNQRMAQLLMNFFTAQQ